MTILDLILCILCAYRLTQLVVHDVISMPVTDWLSGLHPKLEEFLCCPHCVGFWVSVLTVGVMIGANYWQPLIYGVWAFAVAGAISIIEHATGWLGRSLT